MMAVTHPSTRGFLDLWEHVHACSGLAFAEGQLAFLSRRVEPRLRELGLESYSAYLERVREDEHELALLLDAVTVNDTAFWREPGPFRAIVDLLVPTLLDRLPRPLRVWSAGCATGEEPYTLGMLLLDHFGENAPAQVNFLATDISGRAVDQASRGIYRATAVEQLPRAWRDTYFRPHADGFRVSDELRSLVRFEQGNLQQEEWPADTQDRDVIFCRNVMIYFSQGVRRDVAARLHAALSPGGYLILGARESLHDVGRQFTHRYVGDSLYYGKQPSG